MKIKTRKQYIDTQVERWQLYALLEVMKEQNAPENAIMDMGTKVALLEDALMIYEGANDDVPGRS